MIGKFVAAKLKGRTMACRQGWVISENPLIIKGQSGTVYECEGNPVKVINPPIRKSAISPKPKPKKRYAAKGPSWITADPDIPGLIN